jgi:hypothetical protein
MICAAGAIFKAAWWLNDPRSPWIATLFMLMVPFHRLAYTVTSSVYRVFNNAKTRKDLQRKSRGPIRETEMVSRISRQRSVIPSFNHGLEREFHREAMYE